MIGRMHRPATSPIPAAGLAGACARASAKAIVKTTP
jgi:hypothetical protein